MTHIGSHKDDNFFVKATKPMITGKVITVEMPTKGQADEYNRWQEYKQDFNRKLEMLNEQIQKSEGETKQAYQKELASLLMSWKSAPVFKKMKAIKFRTISGTTNGFQNIEPYDKLSTNNLRKLGY